MHSIFFFKHSTYNSIYTTLSYAFIHIKFIYNLLFIYFKYFRNRFYYLILIFRRNNKKKEKKRKVIIYLQKYRPIFFSIYFFFSMLKHAQFLSILFFFFFFNMSVNYCFIFLTTTSFLLSQTVFCSMFLIFLREKEGSFTYLPKLQLIGY